PLRGSEPGGPVCGEATTGRQALSQALELKPDVIVLDLSLPEMNGVEVIRQVRRTSTAAIVIVTMHDSDEIVQEAIGAGANAYVLKADAGRALADAVRTILSSGQFVSERVRAAAGQPFVNASEMRRRERLTMREREVLQLLAEGQANKEIASLL